MEKKNKKLPIIIGAIVLMVIAVVVVVLLTGDKGHRVIKVKSFLGQVSLERDSSEKDIFEGMKLKSKDTVTTGGDGLVELLVDEDKHIVAEANTSFTITSSGDEKKGKLKIKLLYGTSLVEIENKLPSGSSVEVETPNATLSVRGTIFETTYNDEDDTTVVKVTEGVVSVATDEETAVVEAGNMATIKDDKIKVTPLPIEYIDEESFEVSYSTDDTSTDSNEYISEGDWPELIKGGSTSSQLEYMLKIAQIGKSEGSSNYLEIALRDLCNTQTSAIEELYKTPENNNVYAIDKLNNMFSFLTDDKIGEEHLTPPSTINGNELTCVYSEPLSGEHIINTIIVNAYYDDNNEIIVEFRYTIFNYDNTELKDVDSVAHLVQDETGKYVFGYIE